MIIIGIVLLILGFITGIGILWILGIFAIVLGLILTLAGGYGHGLGGRRTYW